MSLTMGSVDYKMWEQESRMRGQNLDLGSLKYFIMPDRQDCGLNTIPHVKFATSYQVEE